MAIPLWLTKLLVRTRLAGFTPRARRLTDGGTGYLKYYSDRVLAAPVGELLDPAYSPESPGPDVIDMNLPAPRAEAGTGVGRVAADRRGNSPAWGLPELRAAIADHYARRDGRTVDPDHEVFVTHGATAAFAAVLDAFVNPGDRVVLFDPCSPLFALGAKSRRASVRWVPTWAEDGRCRYPAAAFEKAVRGAKLLVLADPNNPTGACFTNEDLEHIAWIAAGYDVLIYADETFDRFRYGDRPRSLATLPGADRRTLTAGSLGAHGLGALRTGWLAGPRHLVKACALTANLAAPFVPTVCQHAAARALAEGDENFTPTLEQFRGKRQYAFDRLKAMGLEPDWPGGGFFLWVPVAQLGLDGRVFAERLLRERQVLVGPGCVFGPGGNGHVRVSFATDDGRLREGLARMAAFVAGLTNPTAAAEEPPVEEVPADVATNPGDTAQPVFSRA